jgi:hypothetical protein
VTKCYLSEFFKTRVILIGLLASVCALSGCSRKEQAADGTPGAVEQKKTQEHSGELFVKILPESPTTGDELHAVFSSAVSVSWQWQKNGQLLENEKNPKLATSRFAKGDSISVVVTAGGKVGKASVTIANSPPEIGAVRLTPDYVCRGVDITAVPNSKDADGDEIRYRCTWKVNGEDTYDDSLVLKGDRFKKGDRISAVITPYDSEGTGKAFMTQALTVPDAAPVFTTIPPGSFQGKMYTYNAVAHDPDGDAVNYSLAKSPKGMTIDSKSGAIRWPVGADDTGNHDIELIAQDSEGAKSFQQFSLHTTTPAGVAR